MSATGGQCTAGNFCPEGSGAMEACTAGSYCLTNGLAAPTGPCNAGWYCPTGATSPTQVICCKRWGVKKELINELLFSYKKL